MVTSTNLVQLIDRYNCDDKCRDTLELLRWPTGVCCTRCGDTDVNELEKHNRWHCRGCDYQFSVTSGTIMHDSHLPLRKWFLAIYLMVESRKGMSANQLKRTARCELPHGLVSLPSHPQGDGSRAPGRPCSRGYCRGR